MKRTMVVAVLLGFTAVSPCNAQDDHHGLKAAIAAGNSGFVEAFKRGDAKAMAADYADDGIYVSAARTVKGRDAIEKMFASRLGKLRFLGGACRTDDLVVDGNMASEMGRCTYEFAGKPPAGGKFLTVWHYIAGKWRIQMNAGM